MGWNLFRRPVLFSLLFALLGGFIMVHGLAVDNAGASRAGLAIMVSLAPLPLLWRITFAPAPWVEQNDTQTVPTSPRFDALLAGALAMHALISFWLWWWVGEPFFGSFFAVIGGLLALQHFLFAVIAWRPRRLQGQKGSGVELRPTKAEPTAPSSRPRD